MKTNIRLKIITISFASAYCFIIGEFLFADMVSAMMAGFQKGYEYGINIKEHGDETFTSALDEMDEIIMFQVKPKEYGSLPTALTMLNGTTLFAQSDQFFTTIKNPVRPLWIRIARTFSWIVSFCLMVILIYIPVQVGKVIRSVLKNEIFDMKNVKRLRKTGYALLLVFVLAATFGIIYTIDARNLIQLADYRIIFSLKEDYIYLLFGLATLLFAEILKISHTMKEEQELTV